MFADFWSTIWNTIWWFITIFVFIAYLMALFSIISDLFRDKKLNGWAKAIWFVFLIFLPFVTAIVYLIARGSGMSERAAKEQKQVEDAAEAYVRSVAGTSPAAEIAQAKQLLDQGVITPDEFNSLKAAALSGRN
ncbi:SHOCT domain-containing protein [Pseudoclavibacter sp. CFCC 11306]|uniref:SHOCT domain-containing protein n=1 Tax=Pseudoclavibacter sp. CFCC 11306 TaxID=1564493 RepID=UPI00130167E5|nr:SHOCT domain-containing protein [Pseudoclavibacter sp. CFCC 11306]KAB1657082.1 SHOCT domain-containing protein [Pseudoclavibacter sp. CFCC 11306]